MIIILSYFNNSFGHLAIPVHLNGNDKGLLTISRPLCVIKLSNLRKYKITKVTKYFQFRGEKDEVCKVGSRNKIFKILYLESSKNQERSFQIFLNSSRIKNFDYQDPFSRRNQDILDPLLDNKQEGRNIIKDFKRRNIKNQDQILTINQWKCVHL